MANSPYGLVSPPKRYRSWSRRADGTWQCVHTSDDLRQCRQRGEVTLPYPDVPADVPNAAYHSPRGASDVPAPTRPPRRPGGPFNHSRGPTL